MNEMIQKIKNFIYLFTFFSTKLIKHKEFYYFSHLLYRKHTHTHDSTPNPHKRQTLMYTARLEVENYNSVMN